MTAKLSPKMQEALDVARRTGGIVYRKGGFWTAPDAEPTGLHWAGNDLQWEWHTTKGTVRALVTRGLLRWARTELYPDWDSAAVLAFDPADVVDEPHPDRCGVPQSLNASSSRCILPAGHGDTDHRDGDGTGWSGDPRVGVRNRYDAALVDAKRRGEHPSNREVLAQLDIAIDPDTADPRDTRTLLTRDR